MEGEKGGRRYRGGKQLTGERRSGESIRISCV